jgi:hypothetical protein
MIDNEERPEEARQSVDFRQLRELAYNRLAERYRYRPLKRWLMVETGRNDVVFAGMAVVSLMFFLFFSYVAIQSLKPALEVWYLHLNGIATQALVLEATDWGRSYSASYIYEAATGDGGTESIINGERVVTRKVYESLVVGEEVSIRYDPADPSRSIIKGNGVFTLNIAISLMLAYIFVLPTILLIMLPLIALRNRIAQWVRG